MPIKIPDNLPARQFLKQEGLMVMEESAAYRQDIRPLKILLLNLMPLKEKTELQIARLIASSPLQIELTLLTTASYVASHTNQSHMIDFYYTLDDVRDRKFDGLIITGAPIEHLPFEEVTYWDELTSIFDWSLTHCHQTFFICWAAQAAGFHFFDVPKYPLKNKMFGVYDHQAFNLSTPLLMGFTDIFPVPVSRHTEVRHEDVEKVKDLEILASSEQSGLCLMQCLKLRQVYMFNHLEYDSNSLGDEYARDVKAGADIQIPKGYFPDDDPSLKPVNRWRSHAHLLFVNWLNDLYQTTPFDINKIGE